MKRHKNSFIVIGLVFLFMSMLIISGCAGKAGEGKGIYYCPMHPTYTSDKPGDCPICNMKLVKKEIKGEIKGSHNGHAMNMQTKPQEKMSEAVCIEHNCTMKDCPMRVKVDMKPGEKIICPICGEYITTRSGKIVAAEKKDMPGPGVMISPERQQLIGIKTEPVSVRKLAKTIRASSKIAYDPELVVVQEEFVQAIINQENVKDSPLKDVIDRAGAITEAARRKLRLLGMSEEQIAELEKSRKVDTSLYLPKKGENVWAYIAIYEYEIGLVKIGQEVEIEALAYPGERFHGRVVSINPVLDPTTRTNQVRSEVENTEGKLKPEMFINAKIFVDIGDKLAVPEAAVLDTGIRKLVYLSRDEGLLEAREVRLGQKAEGYYEVVEGLKEGDIVVTSGNFFVDSESKLKAAVSGTGHQQHGQ